MLLLLLLFLQLLESLGQIILVGTWWSKQAFPSGGGRHKGQTRLAQLSFGRSMERELWLLMLGLKGSEGGWFGVTAPQFARLFACLLGSLLQLAFIILSTMHYPSFDISLLLCFCLSLPFSPPSTEAPSLSFSWSLSLYLYVTVLSVSFPQSHTCRRKPQSWRCAWLSPQLIPPPGTTPTTTTLPLTLVPCHNPSLRLYQTIDSSSFRCACKVSL